MARLKISISLENFKILKFFKIWALREAMTMTKIRSRIGHAILFTIFVHDFGAAFPPLPPKQQSDGFESVLKEPQTELRTLSQNCEQTLPKLRTNPKDPPVLFLVRSPIP